MVFDHVVKHNGKYYAAGEDVPMEQEKKKPSAPSDFSEPKRRGRQPKQVRED